MAAQQIAEGQVLIGGAGKEFVEQTLSTEGPRKGLDKISKLCNLTHPVVPALMGMVDQLGITRLDAHKAVLNAAKTALIARVHALGGKAVSGASGSSMGGGGERDKDCKARLERLLAASFRWVGRLPLAPLCTSACTMNEKVQCAPYCAPVQ